MDSDADKAVDKAVARGIDPLVTRETAEDVAKLFDQLDDPIFAVEEERAGLGLAPILIVTTPNGRRVIGREAKEYLGRIVADLVRHGAKAVLAIAMFDGYGEAMITQGEKYAKVWIGKGH